MTCLRCGGSGLYSDCIDDLCHGNEECIHGDDPTCRECGGEGEVPPYSDDEELDNEWGEEEG